jgi:hypothetical protein
MSTIVNRYRILTGDGQPFVDLKTTYRGAGTHPDIEWKLESGKDYKLIDPFYQEVHYSPEQIVVVGSLADKRMSPIEQIYMREECDKLRKSRDAWRKRADELKAEYQKLDKAKQQVVKNCDEYSAKAVHDYKEIKRITEDRDKWQQCANTRAENYRVVSDMSDDLYEENKVLKNKVKGFSTENSGKIEPQVNWEAMYKGVNNDLNHAEERIVKLEKQNEEMISIQNANAELVRQMTERGIRNQMLEEKNVWQADRINEMSKLLTAIRKFVTENT